MELLIEYEKALHQYEIRQNKKMIFKLLHPDFREIGMSGSSYNFTKINEMLATEKPSLGIIHSQDYECINVGSKVKQILYKSVFIEQNGKCTDFAIRSSIWIMVNNDWKMKFHQGTPCTEFKVNL